MDAADPLVRVIHKLPDDSHAQPNLNDYEALRATFTWDEARGWLDGLPAGGINIAHEAVDRHVTHGRGEHVALRCLGKDGSTSDITYGELSQRTSAFAHGLRALGLEPGDRVFSLVGRVPWLYVAMIGSFKARCVFSPLFSAFGPEPVRQRITLGDGRALVTSADLYRKKVAPVRAELPALTHILLVDPPGTDVSDIPGALHLDEMVAGQSTKFAIEPTGDEELALLTAEAIARDGLTLVGWVANQVDPHMAAVQSNLDTLRARLPGTCLGAIPWLPAPAPDPPARYLQPLPKNN